MATIRKDPRGSGRWQVRYRDPSGKQRTKGGFPRKREAEKWANAVETDISRGDFLDPARGRATFGDVAEQWLGYQRHLKPKTLADYTRIVDRRLVPDLGTVPMARLTHARVQDYVADLVAEGCNPPTIRNVFGVLKLVLGFAVREGYIKNNPADGVTRPRVAKNKMLFLARQQVDALAAALPARYRMYVLLAVGTGLRAGELVALLVSDFTDDLSAVRVTRSVADVSGRLVEGTTKNERNRVVGVPGLLRDELREHLDLVHPTGWGTDVVVFPPEGNGNGSSPYMRHANFARRHFRPAVRQALPPELHGLRFHDLRHTCASLLIALGAHPKSICTRLGHSSINVTMDRYGHLYPDQEEALTAAMDAELRAGREERAAA